MGIPNTGQGMSWNTSLARMIAEAIAAEASAIGVDTVRALYLPAPFCSMGEIVDFVYLIATMPGHA